MQLTNQPINKQFKIMEEVLIYFYNLVFSAACGTQAPQIERYIEPI